MVMASLDNELTIAFSMAQLTLNDTCDRFRIEQLRRLLIEYFETTDSKLNLCSLTNRNDINIDIIRG